MSEYPCSKGKRRYFSKQFRKSYDKNVKNDREFEDKFQVFVDSLDMAHVKSEPVPIRNKRAQKNCSGFKVYKARAYSKGNVSYRVMFSIKKNSVFFLQLHSKSKNDEANHDEVPICEALNVVKERRCDEEFCMLDNPMVLVRSIGKKT